MIHYRVNVSAYPKNILISENKIPGNDVPVLMKPYTRNDLAVMLRTILNTETSDK